MCFIYDLLTYDNSTGGEEVTDYELLHRYMQRQIKRLCNALEGLQGRVALAAFKSRNNGLATAYGFCKFCLRPAALKTVVNNSFNQSILRAKCTVLRFYCLVFESFYFELFERSCHDMNITYKLYYCNLSLGQVQTQKAPEGANVLMGGSGGI